MGPHRGHTFLLASILLFLEVSIVSGTHFRYGTISWWPLERGTDGCSGWPAGFEMQAAFRRNYDWGRWYKEEWQWGNATDNTQWWNGGSNMYGGSVGGGHTEDKSGWIHFDGDPKAYESNFLLRFKTGMSARGMDLAPSMDTGLPENENKGGKMCDVFYHKGWNITDPLYPLGKLIPDNQALNSKLMVCTPWNEGFGWFWGDGTTENAGVVFKVTNIDSRESMLGNVLRATSLPFSHCYAKGAEDGAKKPWTAFFTSGNRIHNLNNNPDGRYRLEVQILMTGDGNNSPRATQIPVLPVPYTDSPSHARFQIAAFDPDIGDTQTFRLGNSREFGAIMAHRIVDAQGSTFNTWFQDVYEQVLCGARMCSNTDCSRKYVPDWCPSYNPAAHDKPPATWDQPAIPWNNATFNAGPPPDLDINFYTGFVTFRTGKDPWTPSTARPDLKMPSFPAKKPGFWNLVVMIADEKHGGITVPLDFLLYLYPPVKFCSVDCVNKKAGIATFDSFDGMYGDPSEKEGTDLYVYNGPGTGFCSICGGGGVPVDSTGKTVTDFNTYKDYVNVAFRQDMVYNQSYCEIFLNATGHPVETGMPNLTDSYNAGKKWPYMCRQESMCTPTPMLKPGVVEVGRGSCMGVEDGPTVLPYINDMAVCRLNTKPRFIPPTPPLGPTILTGKYAGSATPAKVYLYVCDDAKFRLQATDDDECVSLTIGTTGLYKGMALGDHHRVDPYTVWRDFTWPANCIGKDDVRPRLTMVCFYAFDYYLITADPFHCVEIHIVDPPNPPPPRPPPPPPPPPPSCGPACEVPWINCPQVRNNTNFDCLDGVICPRGFWRCGHDRENFFCYDPQYYSCVANEVVNGTGMDDLTAIKNCTARCLKQYSTCNFWANCDGDNTDTEWCIDEVMVPTGKWRCGNAPYYPDLDACLLGTDGMPIRAPREYSYDLKFDGYGKGPCNDTVPLPTHHGCRKECPRKYLWQNCATPYLPGELECIDGHLCPPTTYLYRASEKLFGCLRPIAPINDFDSNARGLEEATGLGPCTYMVPAIDVKPHGDSPDTRLVDAL